MTSQKQARLDRLSVAKKERDQSSGCVFIYTLGHRPKVLPPGTVFLMPHNNREPNEATYARAAASH